MKRLEKLQPEDPTFAAELTTLMEEIREHVAEEEQEMFPHMRQVFTEAELVEIGSKVEAVKKIAPTRPHPTAPDQPPGDKILGPMTGLLIGRKFPPRSKSYCTQAEMQVPETQRRRKPGRVRPVVSCARSGPAF